jgi:PKD repeat protein
MKKLFRPLLYLFFAAAMVSCSNSNDVIEEQIVDGKRPLVKYEIVPGDDPFTFKFENNSENYKNLEWRFGDDSLSTDVSPEHVFLATGRYEVNLTAISEGGATARKLLVININPDDVVKINAVKTGLENEVKFSVASLAEIDAVEWTFGPEEVSVDPSPVMTYGIGTLNPFKLKMTTKKGSVVELEKFGTTEGIVTNVTNLVTSQVSKDNGGGPSANEGSLKIIDNNVETKLYLPGWGGSWSMQFQFPSETTIKYYGIGNGNDSPDRDPKNWTLEGSNDGINWTVVDTRAQAKNFYDQMTDRGATNDDARYKKMFYFAVANPQAFAFYKYNVTSNFGSGDFQISEFRLYK